MIHEKIHTLLVVPKDKTHDSIRFTMRHSGEVIARVVSDTFCALDLFRRSRPELVLIDLSVGDHESMALCREIQRVYSGARVILLADQATTLPAEAFQMGVSSIVRIGRGLSSTELIAILKDQSNGLQARYGPAERAKRPRLKEGDHWEAASLDSCPEGAVGQDTVIEVGPLRIDLGRRRITHAGRRIRLTRREFDLLAYLALNLDRVVTFDELLNKVWQYTDAKGDPAQVRLYIARLRRKLGEHDDMPPLIHSERGVGYCLESASANSMRAA